MTDAIGHIEALYRYPVKSMAGAMLETAELGWHGLAGDRRFAFRRVQDQSAFPWLTASRLPALILYQPEYQYQPDGQSSAPDAVPTHIRTPTGNLLPFAGEALNEEITDRFGAPVQLMQLKQGVFDETPISIITTTTMHKIAAESGTTADIRRFRPNIVLHLDSREPFSEDQWLGKALVFGTDDHSPAVNIALRDERCVIINLHPDTAQSNPALLKSVVRLNQNYAGVYGTVIRRGILKINDKVYLRPLP